MCVRSIDEEIKPVPALNIHACVCLRCVCVLFTINTKATATLAAINVI